MNLMYSISEKKRISREIFESIPTNIKYLTDCQLLKSSQQKSTSRIVENQEQPEVFIRNI